MFWVVAIISVVFVGLSFVGIGIKMLLRKGGKFERHCAGESGKMCHCKDEKCKMGVKCQNKNVVNN